MSIPCKFERSILSYDEHEIILRTHHPEIYDAALDDLKALRQRLREMRDKERTLARENRRAVRGKGAQRGASFPGTAEHPLRRKQVFAAAQGPRLGGQHVAYRLERLLGLAFLDKSEQCVEDDDAEDDRRVDP